MIERQNDAFMNIQAQRLAHIKARFRLSFGHEPRALISAPGRVNLIGEHTDYNQGFVLPVALDRRLLLAAARREDRWVKLRSMNLGEASFSLDDLLRGDHWSDYPKGVAGELERGGYRLPGMEAIIWSDLPMEGGLGSSAALEVAVAYAFQILAGFQMAPLELALLCQRAESEFVGLACGLMDQLAAVFGKEGGALFIDCRELTWELVPLPPQVKIAVADTGKPRGLRASEYNRRREECQEGARLLGVASLRDISPPELDEKEGELPPPIFRRVRHVVRENQRVLEAAQALREGKLEKMGRLMYESHGSLRDDFQVSTPELDILVEAARRVPGVYGSRLTGAGFGGCTVSLVDEGKVDEFRKQLAQAYAEAVGFEPAIYICGSADGVKEI